MLRTIDEARRALGVSQKQLADILDRSQPAVSQFFSGSYAVTIDSATEYLAALHLQARVDILPAEEGEPALVVRSLIDEDSDERESLVDWLGDKGARLETEAPKTRT